MSGFDLFITANNMVINLQESKATFDDNIQMLVKDKVAGLEHYYSNIIKADIEIGMTTHHHQKGDIYRAEVNLDVPGKVLRAEAETDDITKSINEVYDKLKRELIKYKEMHS